MDCTVEKETCEEHGISGFPTLKIFRKGELSQNYEGPREADGIVKHMRKQAGPSAKEIKTLKEYEKLLEADDAVVCGQLVYTILAQIFILLVVSSVVIMVSTSSHNLLGPLLEVFFLR